MQYLSTLEGLCMRVMLDGADVDDGMIVDRRDRRSDSDAIPFLSNEWNGT